MQTYTYRFFLFVLIFSSYTLNPIFSQTVSLSGHTKGSLYGAGETYDFTTAFTELSLTPEYKQGRTYVYSDIRFRTGLQFDEKFSQFQIKEAYAAYRGDRLDLSLGNQIVKWGRTDGFNPTNYLTSNNFFLLSGDPDDQTLGTFMMKINYRFSQVMDLEIVTIPFYNPSVYRYELFDFGEQASFGTANMPENSFENASLAGRLNFDFSAIGFSLSGFRGYDPFYGFNVAGIDWSTGAPQISYAASPYLRNSVGADLAVPLGSWIIRAEAAYNSTEDYEVNMNIPNPHLSYVAGLETSFAGVTAIAQYIGKYDLKYTELEMPQLLDPTDQMAQLYYANSMIAYESESYNRNVFNLTEEMNHGIALSFNKSFSYDMVNIELTGYYQITTEEYLLRPKVSFRLSDGLNLAVGGQYMDGPEGSVFNVAGKIMSGGFLELKASF